MSTTQAKAPRAPRQARSKQRVEQILAAARSLVLSKGFAGLKMAEIAETAGVTPSSIYQYFSNKRAIVLHLAERHLELGQLALRSLIEPRPETLEEFGERVDAGLEAYYLALRADPLVRHLRTAFAADAQLRELETRDAHELERQLFEGTKHLFHRNRYEAVKLAYGLFSEFAGVGIERAIELDEAQGRALMDLLYLNLDACWEASIVPHAKPRS